MPEFTPDRHNQLKSKISSIQHTAMDMSAQVVEHPILFRRAILGAIRDLNEMVIALLELLERPEHSELIEALYAQLATQSHLFDQDTEGSNPYDLTPFYALWALVLQDRDNVFLQKIDALRDKAAEQPELAFNVKACAAGFAVGSAIILGVGLLLLASLPLHIALPPIIILPLVIVLIGYVKSRVYPVIQAQCEAQAQDIEDKINPIQEKTTLLFGLSPIEDQRGREHQALMQASFFVKMNAVKHYYPALLQDVADNNAIRNGR